MQALIAKDNSIKDIFKSRMAAGRVGLRAELDQLVPVNIEMSEGQLTRVANFLNENTIFKVDGDERKGNIVKRIRDKSRALRIIRDVFPLYQSQKVSQKNSGTTPIKKSEKGCLNVKKKGIKNQIRKIFVDSPLGLLTVDELMEKTGGTESTVKTALSDLKSDKYAGPDGALAILKTKDGEYYLANN